MAKHNQPSGIKVDPAYIARVLIQKVDDVRERLSRHAADPTRDKYNVLNVATLLNSLVLDAPLCDVVNQDLAIELFAHEWVMPTWEGVKPEVTMAPHYAPYLPEHGPHFWQGGRWYPFSIPAYLQRPLPGFVVMQKTMAPKEAIGLYANALGGKHLSGDILNRDVNAAQIDAAITFDKESGVAWKLMGTIAPTLTIALGPLYDAAKAKYFSGAPADPPTPSA